ncbi:MAG: hypothetical protein M0R46_09610 [Candidatus Muirbacterium halophilum]|nr:hypothetical protein [Candidatus Muirbacterium halophilum]
MNCNKNHDDIKKILDSLKDDQGGVGRHKCAGCAYEKGFDYGKTKNDNFNLKDELHKLPESQASTQRHKCASSAFCQGYIEGRK